MTIDGRSYWDPSSKSEKKLESTSDFKNFKHAVVSSHVVDNIIPTISHANIKTMTKNWLMITKRDLLHVRSKNFHDFRS